jgi:hypothetical protein
MTQLRRSASDARRWNMQVRERLANALSRHWLGWPLALAGAVMLAAPVTAQSPPPVRGTVALEGTMKKVYGAANTVMVTTIDGVEHVIHFTRDLIVHGGKGTGIDALNGWREGSSVVVHYTSDGSWAAAQEIDRIADDGLKVTEGVITKVNHRRRQVTVRFDDGESETFRLTDRAAIETESHDGEFAGGPTRVTLYYSDGTGKKIAHFVKRSSS